VKCFRPARQGSGARRFEPFGIPYVGFLFRCASDPLHGGLIAIFQATGKIAPDDKAQGRALMKGLLARGTDLRAPGSWMGSASRGPYISYLSGGGSVGEYKVLVLTERLPKHPQTREGNLRMERGQVR
jgi:hypothetical protein